jgi:hypothetical protein
MREINKELYFYLSSLSESEVADELKKFSSEEKAKLREIHNNLTLLECVRVINMQKDVIIRNVNKIEGNNLTYEELTRITDNARKQGLKIVAET